MSVSIADIPIPEDLSEVRKAEYRAYQAATLQLEKEWEDLHKGDNVDQQSCIELLKEIKANRTQQAEERLSKRLEVIGMQVEREKERIDKEMQESRKALFERLVRAYYQSYQNIATQLRELLGKDYTAYITSHAIEFPSMPSDSQMKTRLQQPEEAKVRLTQAEIDRDLKKLQQMYHSGE